MEEKKVNKRIVFSVVAVLLLIAVVAGATYAYFSAGASSAAQEVTTAKLELTFDDSTAIINATNITPIKTDQVLTKAAKKSFTIKKTTNESADMYAKIELANIVNTEALAKYDFKWALYQGTTPVATGDFGGKTSGNIVLATNQFINSTTGLSYDLYIWINETGLNQNTMQGQTFTGTIKVTADINKLNTLASKILGENNANVSTSTPDLSAYAGAGDLYVQQGDVTKSEMGFPTYYFRGHLRISESSPTYIYSTFVKFGGYTWRIVRINEDGSIRLITNDAIATNKQWMTDSWYNYSYVDPENYYYSIKKVLEDWYDSNISNINTLNSKVVMSTFCSDDSDLTSTGGAALTRLNASEPIFTCPSKADIVYSKVATITADEAFYSGITFENGTAYLNEGSEYWTMTKYKGGSPNFEFTIAGSGLETMYQLGSSNVRAVINLSPDVEVLSGDGLSEDTAYVIK